MGIHRALQMGIRQSSDLDKCVLHLSVPAKYVSMEDLIQNFLF